MRKLVAAIVLFLLAGCSPATEPEVTPSATSTPTVTESATVEPTPEKTAEPSDVTTEVAGENVTYRMAGNKLSMVAPATWQNVVESTRAFPVALQNPEGTARFVIGAIGKASLAPGSDAYVELLREHLGLAEDEIVYLGEQPLGVSYAPAYRIVTDTYMAHVYLLTVKDTLYEVTVRGSDDAGLGAALNVASTIEVAD